MGNSRVRNDNDVYYVDGSNEVLITLRKFMFRFIKVDIPRSSVASVKDVLGVMKVETTGGKTYRVNRGLTAAQQLRTAEAFGDHA